MIVNIEETGDIKLTAAGSIQELADAVAQETLRVTAAPQEALVDLWLCGEEEIRQLNERYRSLDAGTDVLSFPNFDLEGPALWPDPLPGDALDPETGSLCLGSIALCKERALKQAEEYGHSLRRETAFLIAHSMLHLCGYDHETREEAAVMERLQEQILDTLGISRDPDESE